MTKTCTVHSWEGDVCTRCGLEIVVVKYRQHIGPKPQLSWKGNPVIGTGDRLSITHTTSEDRPESGNPSSGA